MKKLSIYVVIIALLSLIGCATVDRGAKYSDLKITPVDDNQSRIFIFFADRDFASSPAPLPININGKLASHIDMGSFYYFEAPPQEYIIDLGEIEKHKVWIKPEPKTSYYLSVDVNMKKRQVRGFGGLLLGVVGGMIAEGMAGPNYGMININSNYYRTINAASAEYQILPVEEKIAIEKLKEMEVILPSKK